MLALLCGGCGAPTVPLTPAHRIAREVSVRPHPGELDIGYWMLNQSSDALRFDFSRLCGTVADPGGREIYRFAQVGHSVPSTDRLPPDNDATFDLTIPLQRLGTLNPGVHTVRAWPCKYEYLDAQNTFTVQGSAWELPSGTHPNLRIEVQGTQVADRSLVVGFSVKNNDDYTVMLDVSRSELVCGVVLDMNGKEVFRFPEVVGGGGDAPGIPPGERRSVSIRLPAQGGRELAAGKYTVEAWLCGDGRFGAVGAFEILPKQN